HHGRAGRDRCLAPDPGARRGRILGADARRGSGPDPHSPRTWVADRLRRWRGGLHRGAGHAARPIGSAVPLELWDPAVRVEAPRRAVPLARARLGRAPERVDLPARLSVPCAGGRPAVRVVAPHRVLEQAPARRGVRDAKPGAGGRVLRRVPRRGLAGGRGRLADGKRRRERAGLADTAATLRLPAGALLGGRQGRGGRRAGPRTWVGQTRAEGHRRTAQGRLNRRCEVLRLGMGILVALLSLFRLAVAQTWAAAASAGTVHLTDSSSLIALGGVVEYRALRWLTLGAAPTLVRITVGTQTTSGFGDLPLTAAASKELGPAWGPELAAAVILTIPTGNAACGLGNGVTSVGMEVGAGLSPIDPLHLSVDASRSLSAVTLSSLDAQGSTWLDLDADVEFTPQIGRAQ